MGSTTTTLREIIDLDPREAALRVIDAQRERGAWLDEFSAQLDRHRAGQSLARTLAVWDLSQSEAARCFGVSRQAVSKWLDAGAPAERNGAIADLAAATDLLVRYLKRDRIPAVVRRPIPSMDGRSLLDLLAEGRTGAILTTCREMFDFDRVLS